MRVRRCSQLIALAIGGRVTAAGGQTAMEWKWTECNLAPFVSYVSVTLCASDSFQIAYASVVVSQMSGWIISIVHHTTAVRDENEYEYDRTATHHTLDTQSAIRPLHHHRFRQHRSLLAAPLDAAASVTFWLRATFFPLPLLRCLAISRRRPSRCTWAGWIQACRSRSCTTSSHVLAQSRKCGSPGNSHDHNRTSIPPSCCSDSPLSSPSLCLVVRRNPPGFAVSSSLHHYTTAALTS